MVFTFRKTGYKDIDVLLSNTQTLLKRGDNLKRQIDEALIYSEMNFLKYQNRYPKRRFQKK